MTLGQVFFILVVLIAASLMSFYLGAKFGNNVMHLGLRSSDDAIDTFLPDERLTAEVNQILASHTEALVFHDAVQTGGNATVLKSDPVMPVETKVEVKTVAPPVASSPAAKLATAKIEAPAKIEVATPASAKSSINLPENTIAYTVPESAALVMPTPSTPQALTQAQPSLPVAAMPQVDEPQNYRLQLGSYSDEARAQQAKSDWEKRGFRVSVIKSAIPGKGTWYRLNVGSYSSKAEAEEAQRQIVQKYQQTAMILQ